MSGQLLIVIEGVFDLSSCLVPLPGSDSSVAASLKGTTIVKLAHPNRTSSVVEMLGIELITPNPKRTYPIALRPNLGKDGIPN